MRGVDLCSPHFCQQRVLPKKGWPVEWRRSISWRQGPRNLTGPLMLEIPSAQYEMGRVYDAEEASDIIKEENVRRQSMVI